MTLDFVLYSPLFEIYSSESTQYHVIKYKAGIKEQSGCRKILDPLVSPKALHIVVSV